MSFTLSRAMLKPSEELTLTVTLDLTHSHCQHLQNVCASRRSGKLNLVNLQTMIKSIQQQHDPSLPSSTMTRARRTQDKAMPGLTEPEKVIHGFLSRAEHLEATATSTRRVKHRTNKSLRPRTHSSPDRNIVHCDSFRRASDSPTPFDLCPWNVSDAKITSEFRCIARTIQESGISKTRSTYTCRRFANGSGRPLKPNYGAKNPPAPSKISFSNRDIRCEPRCTGIRNARWHHLEITSGP